MLLFIDSFDHYSTSNLSTKYNNVTAGEIVSSGRNGTNCAKFGGGGQIMRTLQGNYQTIIAGFAFSAASLASAVIFKFIDTSTDQIRLSLNSNGTFSIKRGDNTLLGTTTNSILNNQWYYIELKAYISNADGYCELRVNGSQWLYLSGIDTQNTSNSYVNTIRFGNDTAGVYFYFDDLYVCDTSGTSNNDFLGDVRIEAIFPNSSGYHSGWTPSSGYNYENVDEVSPNDDTDYNYTLTSGVIDTFGFSDLVSTSGGIYGIQLCIYGRKDDAGSRFVRGVIRRGSNDYFTGDTFSLEDTYKYHIAIVENDPADSSPWTINDVNNSEFGYKFEG